MKAKILLILVSVFIAVLIIDLPISKSKIVGLYINNNFDEESSYAEIPYTRDTLILNENGKYESSYYGTGEYEIQSGFFSNRIDLRNGKFKVYRKLFRPIKIMLVYDLNFYYQKIN